MYLPTRMQGSGFLLRILALCRVCSNTQDLETFSRSASWSGVRISSGSSRAGTIASFGVAVLICFYAKTLILPGDA
jgi:hypothetical protein